MKHYHDNAIPRGRIWRPYSFPEGRKPHGCNSDKYSWQYKPVVYYFINGFAGIDLFNQIGQRSATFSIIAGLYRKHIFVVEFNGFFNYIPVVFQSRRACQTYFEGSLF